MARPICHTGVGGRFPNRGVAQPGLARLTWGQKVAGLNSVAPTFCKSCRKKYLSYLPAVGSAAKFARRKTVNTVLRFYLGGCTMPKLIHSTPRYRRHKASGQAIVTIQGQDRYLGPWKSKA